jgi:hypothetical protein
MASVSSVIPGLSDLLQTLVNIDSPMVSSPAAITVLEKASPTDIVQLREAAVAAGRDGRDVRNPERNPEWLQSERTSRTS